MKLLKKLFENNEAWARRAVAEDPEYFSRLVHQQTPKLHWIGCSDSRVSADRIAGVAPGEVFVHRNVANLMCHGDPNSRSSLQYAVEYLKVEHVIVVGHYGCGGVGAAMQNQDLSDPLDTWLAPVRTLHSRHSDPVAGDRAQWDRLCELNVIEQVRATCALAIIRDAWARHQEVAVHGWIYSVEDGRLRDLNVTVTSSDDLAAIADAAIAEVRTRFQS